MSLECCDKDGQPFIRILVAVPGMGSADIELGRAETVAVFKPSDRDETELMLPHPLMIPQFDFLTRSHSIFSSPFASSLPTVHSLFSPFSPPRFLYLSSSIYNLLNNFE